LIPPQIGHKNRLDEKKPLSAEEVVAIVKDIFVIAAERLNLLNQRAVRTGSTGGVWH
jgi:hypothetical protein